MHLLPKDLLCKARAQILWEGTWKDARRGTRTACQQASCMTIRAVCRDLAINWDEGGMPWTCLPGEPSDVNWCNNPDGWDLYKNPPAGWKGANNHGELGCLQGL